MVDSTTIPVVKRCVKCGVEKSIEAFGRNKTYKDGFSGTCKPCVNLWHAARAKRENIEIPDEKTCPRCKIMKPSSRFWKDKRRSDGLAAYCIDCNNAYYESNGKKGIEPPAEKWCNACQRTLPSDAFTLARKRASGLSTHCKACTAAWREDNREILRQRGVNASKAYYWSHKPIVSVKHSIWRKKNHSLVLAISHRRKTRIAGNGGSFTSKELGHIGHIQNGKCCYCGRLGQPLGIDHVIPVTQGGPSDIWNIALCCYRCNSSKKDRTPQQWIDRWYLR